MGKSKEMIVDKRKGRRPHRPLQFELGVHISEDLAWTVNITQLVKKAQQQRDFFRRLREFGVSVLLAAMTAASARAS